MKSRFFKSSLVFLNVKKRVGYDRFSRLLVVTRLIELILTFIGDAYTDVSVPYLTL